MSALLSLGIGLRSGQRPVSGFGPVQAKEGQTRLFPRASPNGKHSVTDFNMLSVQ